MNPIWLQEIDETQRVIDHWYQMSSASLQTAYHSFMTQIRQLEVHLLGETSRQGDTFAENLLTPNQAIFSDEFAHQNMISPSASHGPVDYDTLIDDVKGSIRASSDHDEETCKHPDHVPPKDYSLSCQVLVQFKRKRTVQYSCSYYIAPGEYVVVGGDRGEDIGLVTHSRTADGDSLNQTDHSWSKGVGEVLRVATPMEVAQLQSVQTELEARAVESAQEKVQEHGLNMRIVDAEYQFDRRKLTFFYQAQQRLDFRNLVRDLYKTFRARIWMEPDSPS
ncbi:unnamed protein product [Phytomonas sp. EM1]|nr:unnamed protein product [Phytomonas sp. EM1]|eukprot:CCW60456.1 unnamed protein product [Phytomonas sp. isolate EM1]